MNFNFNNPYSTTRIPVFARNVVSTSHLLASTAGLRMRLLGGNAVDAAIAAAAVMTIVEPVSNGLGSDSFCIIWDGKELHGLNASGCAPKAWTPEYFKRKYPGTATPPKRGMDTVTVPGAVASWAALSERFGRLAFAELMQPAIDIAERGYLLTPVVQQKWEAATPELQSLPGFANAFLPWGRAPQVGELFQFKAAAKGLRAIAATKGRALYGGEIAAAIVKFSQANGGSHALEDFENYRPEWVKPLAKNYRGHTLHEIPPNGQGIAALIAVGILDKFDVASMPVDSADSQHLQIEAMKLAFADVYKYVAEPSSMAVTPEQMLDDAYLASRAKLIDMKKAQDFGAGNPVKGGTIYLSTADEDGMMVSFIQSNYMGFGSGCVEPEFGISLQNRGHGFSLDEGINQVAPGKRPFHTIIPAFLSKPRAILHPLPPAGESRGEGSPAGLTITNIEPVMSYGVMGANMQPQGHMQTLVRMLDYGQSPQAACDAPRWRYNAGFEINVEAGMNPAVVQALSDRGHRMEVINDSYQDFGAGQFIWLAGNPKVEGYLAASDARRDGMAVGY
jgi:gamma-glutamyltranspeptidase / glutathione hydrolase